jgi:uncharacterized OB-fold protein
VSETAGEADLVTGIVVPISVEYDYTVGAAASRYLERIPEKRIVGQRHGDDGLVYIPPRGSDPADGEPTDQDVELSDRGTVTTYCIVNVPFAGQAVECPYVAAQVLLDGADITFQTLIQEIDVTTIHPGMRVEAVWVDDSELAPTLESIKYFRPSDEPDADPESYKDHM